MITQAEWEIMRVLWYYNEPTSAQVIYTVLQESLQWSESTIKTLLSRLVKKDYIAYEKNGKQFLYYAKEKQLDMLIKKTNHTLNDGCNKDKGKILLDLLQTVDLTKMDAQKMIDVLKKRQVNLLDSVPCYCKKGQCNCRR